MGLVEATLLLLLAVGCAAMAAGLMPLCGGSACEDDSSAVREPAEKPEEVFSRDEVPPFRSHLTSWEWLLVDAAPCCGRRDETLGSDVNLDSLSAPAAAGRNASPASRGTL